MFLWQWQHGSFITAGTPQSWHVSTGPCLASPLAFWEWETSEGGVRNWLTCFHITTRIPTLADSTPGMMREMAIASSTVCYLLLAVAEVCRVLGMTVWGLTRSPATDETRSPHVSQYRCGHWSLLSFLSSPLFIYVQYYVYLRQLDGLPELLSNSDYVCNVLPSTMQTRRLLDGDVLRHCAHKVSHHSTHHRLLGSIL